LDHQGSGEPLLLGPGWGLDDFNIATTITANIRLPGILAAEEKEEDRKIDKFVISNVVDDPRSGIPGQTTPYRQCQRLRPPRPR